MNSSVADTLFAAYTPIVQGERVLFLGARAHGSVTSNMTLWQVFKPYADGLETRGFDVVADLDLVCAGGAFDCVLILMPKSRVEAEYLLARALGALKIGGVIICAAANGAGGKRLAKTLESFGLDGVRCVSKNKARAVSAELGADFDSKSETILAALELGAVQDILGGKYRSQAGLFGWDKMDKGSAFLISNLPEKMSGRGADFGCGYGVLCRAVMERGGESLKSLSCLDADSRAVSICAQNVSDARVSYEWCDITSGAAGLKNLDFIVMNPPFHEGKINDSAIGVSFIKCAQATLKPRGGVLYMVANAQLPYERILSDLFFRVEKLYEGGGFKVYRAET